MSAHAASVRFVLSGGASIDVAVRQLVIAGWTGRDPVAVQHHVDELRKLGVAPPSSTPIFYRASATRLVTGAAIEVCGGDSSGEVEAVLVQAGDRLYVGVGSDHTDRSVETYSVTVAKQMCDKPIAGELWPFGEVEPHWDQLLLRSWATAGGDRVLYQEGAVSSLRPPADLISRFAQGTRLPDGCVMFCGTLAARGGVRAADRFEFELEDPVRRRRIRHGYDIVTIPVVS